jgi:hypothetical protein
VSNRFKKLRFVVLFALVILYSGCELNYEEQQKAYKEEIQKKNSNQEHFQATNKKLDETLERKSFYLPVYSHMYISSENYMKLNISLSIRNTDLSEDLYIESIDYYNTEGKLVKNYISQPHILKPMGTVDFLVELDDMSGGNGAKFLVKFVNKSNVSKPIIQGIMSNIVGNNQVVFITDGQLL